MIISTNIKKKLSKNIEKIKRKNLWNILINNRVNVNKTQDE